MMEGMDDDDFFEEDEPVEKILAITDREPDGHTERPRSEPIAVNAAAFQGVTITGSRLVGFGLSVGDASQVRISR